MSDETLGAMIGRLWRENWTAAGADRDLRAFHARAAVVMKEWERLANDQSLILGKRAVYGRCASEMLALLGELK
jgi:hypothetical protein